MEGGAFGCAWTPELRFALLNRRLLESGDLLGGTVGDFLLLAFEPGERARFDVSLIQFLSDARWLIKGCWYFRRRLETKPLGWSRSGLLDTTCSMLPRDLLLSNSFGGGGGRDEEFEFRTESFSIGGGGLSESGSGVEPDSRSCGRSGTAPTQISTQFGHYISSLYLPCKLVRFMVLPRLFGGSPIKGE